MSSLLRSPRAARLLSTALVALALVGCTTDPLDGPNSGTATAVGELVDKVEAASRKFDQAYQDLQDARKLLEANATDESQFISDRVYSAQYVNHENPAQNEHTNLVHRELQLASGHLPPPTAEAQAAIIETLRDALSKLEQDQAALQRRYAELERQSAELKQEKDILEKHVAAKETALTAAQTERAATLQELGSAEERIKIAAAEAERRNQLQIERENQTRADKARVRIAFIFMGLGGLVLVGSVVASFLRVPGVLGYGLSAGGALFGLGWAITFINDLLQHTWFKVTVGVVLLVAIGLVVLLVLRSLRLRQKAIHDEAIATRTMGAIQDLKNDDATLGTNAYDALRPYLQQWFVDEDGNPDRKLEKEVKSRLVSMNLLNPDESASVVRTAAPTPPSP